MPLPLIHCSGTAYELGLQHGSQAADQVAGSIEFYANMFEQYTGKGWNEIISIAESFSTQIKARWPRYLEEMQGIADGAGVALEAIVALNVRTEIAFGLMDPARMVSDGCTSLAWTGPEFSLMGQNWDWMEEQKRNLIRLEIEGTGFPAIKMITEGGIIGKIGMNSGGLGVCLNAVRCLGNDPTRLPVHLALRMALESRTIACVVERLQSYGTGGSAFLLLGQGTECIGLEFTSSTALRLDHDCMGRIMHSNHLLEKHAGAQEWPEEDSVARMCRLEEMTRALSCPDAKSMDQRFRDIFDDHHGSPVSICRRQEGASQDATLFNIIMDLRRRRATVRIGKLCQTEETWEMGFADECSK